MWTALIIFLLFQQTKPLTNKDVIALVKLDLSSEVVLAKVRQSSCGYDTSPSGLVELKAAGVPDAVTLAMIETPCERVAKSSAPVKPSVRQLHQVKRIFVDEMGKSDDSERFRLLLIDKLSEHFTVVRKEEEADAILSGAMSSQLDKGTTKARASLRLVSVDGQQLWSDDFGVRIAFGLNRDSVKLRAEDAANGLYDAWKRSQKTSDKK